MVKGRQLLTRQQFSEAVFARDGHKCVFCGNPATAAHHIIERRLFNDEGYYLDNGASLCDEHHNLAEETVLSVQDVLKAAGIARPVYPGHIPASEVITKWGDQILPNGQRVRGEMFDTEQVQKVLARADMLHLYTPYVKYPRTLHAPWSLGVQSDDKVLKSTFAMSAHGRIIGTIKLDGENTTMYRDHIHARSLDSKHHRSRDEVKAFWSGIAQEIPERWHICGENMFAQHSIAYDDLAHVFYGFSVWDHRNVALAWDEGRDNTLEWFELLGIQPVEVVYDGVFDEAAMKRISDEVIESGHEGVVFRVADEIPYREFSELVTKVVREAHVKTDQHWMHGEIKRNGFRRPDDEASTGIVSGLPR